MIVTKTVALVEDVETDNPNGAFEVILSAATLDRDGEIIDSRAFEPLPDHIPFDIDHGMTVMTTVGSGTPSYNDAGQLVVKGTYASTALAQEVRTLVSEGHVRTTSVTFMAADRHDDEKGVTHIKTAELLNGTFTPVPSNRESVVLSSKSMRVMTEEKAGARNNTSDASTIQGIHDDAAMLGASCSGKSVTLDEDSKRAIPDSLKSIVGSLEAQCDRVLDALEDAYPDAYPYLRGVLPALVVFDTYEIDTGEVTSWQQPYTDDGSVVTLTATAVEVDVMEVVVPDSDTEEPADTAAVSAAAKATADTTAKSTDEGSVASALNTLAEYETRIQIGE